MEDAFDGAESPPGFGKGGLELVAVREVGPKGQHGCARFLQQFNPADPSAEGIVFPLFLQPMPAAQLALGKGRPAQQDQASLMERGQLLSDFKTQASEAACNEVDAALAQSNAARSVPRLCCLECADPASSCAQYRQVLV